MNVSLEANDPPQAPTEQLSHELPMALSIAVVVLIVASSLFNVTAGTRGGVAHLAGSEVGNLLAAIPLLAVALRLSRRGSLVGQLLWMGALIHIASTYAICVLGTRFSLVLGSYVPIVALSLYALLDVLVDIDAVSVKQAFAAQTATRAVAGFVAFTALALFGLSGVGTRWHHGAAPVSNFVERLDLAFLIPALLGAGALLWRRRPWGFVLAGILLPKAALLGLSWTIAAASLFAHHGVIATVATVALTSACIATTTYFLRSVERPASPLPALRS